MRIDEWLELAWKNGCDPDEMPRMAKLFKDLLDEGSPHKIKKHMSTSVCEV